MASFTDQIPQFNPYIGDLPIEAMVKVGMEKQQRYDMGLQKIQNQIDQVAGLDIIQPAQKAYLESKMNELGSNLKSFAASDFSNFQLVNSVGGMVSQLSKDPTIINAVESTKKYQKGIENMTNLIKEGKGSASRTWEFNQKANEWLNSSDPNAKFDGTYKPYTNYKKNAIEVIKSLTKNSNIRDDAFDFDDKGRMIIKDAMVREKLAGISPEQIQQALLAGLTPDDWEQIEVDGRYSYSNVNGRQFIENINSSYKDNLDSFSKQRMRLENAKSSTSSSVEKAKINKMIYELDKKIEEINSEYSSVSKELQNGNVEGAKARLFTNNFLNNFSKAFSFTETSQTYETSPYVQNQQWREEKEMNWKKFTMEYNQRAAHHADTINMEKEKIKLQKLSLEGYGGLPSPVKDEDLPNISLGKVIAQTEAFSEMVDKADNDLMTSKGKDKAWLDQQRIAWLKSPNGVDPLIAQHFNQTENLRRTADDNKLMISQIENEANKKYGNIYQNIPKDAPNIIYTEANGNRFIYTPKDFVDFNINRNKYMKITPPSGPGAKPVITFDDEKAKAELSPKEYKLYQINKTRGFNLPKNKAEAALVQNIENYDKLVNKPFQKTLSQRDEFIGTEIKNRLIASQGVEYSIPTDTKIKKESFGSLLTSVANLAESQKGGIAKSPNFDLSVLKALAQSGNAEGTIKVVEGTEFAPAMYEVTVKGKEGTTSFKLTPEQKTSVFGNQFEASPEIRAFRPIRAKMQKFSSDGNYLSTSPEKGDTNVKNAGLGPTYFPNVGSYGLSANIVSADGGKTYSLRLNISDPITKQVYEDISYPRLLTESQIVPIMMGLTDASVFQLLNEKTPTTKELQLLQNSSKKPF